MTAEISLQQMSWLTDDGIRRMAAAFSAAGEEIRFVGGCVRNALAGLEVDDLDAATTALPDETIKILESAGIKAIPTGLAHGTITAVFGGWHVEITSLREDIKCDGRHAEVTFGRDWQADACRRDFTMNALYCDMEGQIYDYFNGVNDLDNGVLKFIGAAEDRIKEDYLRILRLFRFWSCFGRESISKNVLETCRSLATGLDHLSGERIRREMSELLETPRAYDALKMMKEFGLESHIWCAQLALDVFATLLVIQRETGKICDWRLSAAALLSKSGQDGSFLEKRWKLSRDDSNHIRQLLQAPLVPNMPFVTAKATMRRMGREQFAEMVLLQWAKEATEYNNISSPNAHAYRSMLGLTHNWVIPKFPLRGEDLVNAGIAPGRELGRILARLEQLWENSDYSLSREQLMSQCANLAKQA